MTASALFRPATRKKSRLRLAIDGVSGSGKTFTALRFATALGQKIAVINSESGAVEKYLGLAPDGVPFEFDVCELHDFAPTSYTQAIQAAGQAGYDVLIIDSLSHAWAGSGGALEIKDKKGGNSFTAWKDVTPMQNKMIDAILTSPCHVIATMRSKQEHLIDVDERGKQTIRKVGVKPVQRDGMEYEFDVYCSLDNDHTLRVTKSRCPSIDGAVIVKPSSLFLSPVVDWLNDGVEVPAEHYAPSENDLLKFEKQQKAAAKAAAPKKTVDQLLAEQAAKAATPVVLPDSTPDDVPFDIPPPAAEYSSELDRPATDEQVAEIRGILTEIKQHAPDDYAKFVAELQATGRKLADFSFGEARELKVKLQAGEALAFFGEQ